jgi:copper(I)-binding protein
MKLEISRPWARMEEPDALEGAGFFTVANRDVEADRLLAARSASAEKIEIHAIKVVGSGIRMRPLESGLRVPGQTTVELKPRGYHLLMSGLNAPWAVGSRVPVSLVFERAGTIEVDLVVEANGPIGKHTLLEGKEP